MRGVSCTHGQYRSTARKERALDAVTRRENASSSSSPSQTCSTGVVGKRTRTAAFLQQRVSVPASNLSPPELELLSAASLEELLSAGRLLEELLERSTARARPARLEEDRLAACTAETSAGEPAATRGRVVRVIAGIEACAEFCRVAREWNVRRRKRGKQSIEKVSASSPRANARTDVNAPGLLSTSYASFSCAIFSSLPPSLSGCALSVAFRLRMGERVSGTSERKVRRRARTMPA